MSPKNCYNRLLSPSQTVNIGSSSLAEFQETARDSNTPEGETKDTFKARMSSMDEQAYVQDQTWEYKHETHRFSDKPFSRH